MRSPRDAKVSESQQPFFSNDSTPSIIPVSLMSCGSVTPGVPEFSSNRLCASALRKRAWPYSFLSAVLFVRTTETLCQSLFGCSKQRQ